MRTSTSILKEVHYLIYALKEMDEKGERSSAVVGAALAFIWTLTESTPGSQEVLTLLRDECERLGHKLLPSEQFLHQEYFSSGTKDFVKDFVHKTDMFTTNPIDVAVRIIEEERATV